jgi:DNA-binding transcriptional MerR regulator
LDGYTARELAAEFRLSIRTIHHYVRLGVLPQPGRGRFARYPPHAWTVLEELRRADDRHRTLAEWAEKFASQNSRHPRGTT